MVAILFYCVKETLTPLPYRGAAMAMAEYLKPGTFSHLVLIEPIITAPPFEPSGGDVYLAGTAHRRSRSHSHHYSDLHFHSIKKSGLIPADHHRPVPDHPRSYSKHGNETTLCPMGPTVHSSIHQGRDLASRSRAG